MSDQNEDSKIARGWKGLLFRWSIAVAVTCGPLLLLGASWTIVGVLFGLEIAGLIVLIWDSQDDTLKYGPVSKWYHIEWNDERILLDVQSERPWRAEIPWESIRSICLDMAANPHHSNTIYIWVDGREPSFPVAFDADNGWELVQQLPKRDLFPPELLVEAMGGVGKTFCYEIRADIGEHHPMLKEDSSSTDSDGEVIIEPHYRG